MNSALSGKAGASYRTRIEAEKRRVREDTPPQALSAEFIPHEWRRRPFMGWEGRTGLTLFTIIDAFALVR